MISILIIGHGIVGKRMEIELEKFSPDVLDKYKSDENKLSFSVAGLTKLYILILYEIFSTGTLLSTHK